MIGAIVAVAVALSVTLGFFWALGTRATPVGPGDRLPAVELPFVMGTTTSRLDVLRGEPLLLVFVETGSPGGLSFAKGVLEFMHRRSLRKGLNLVAVALDPDRDAVRKVLGAEPITYQVLHDPGAAATQEAFGVSQPGDAYLVGPDGVVVNVFVSGDDWSKNRVGEAVEAFVRKTR